MAAAIPTRFPFRVQAVGGKFLADDIGGARVVVRDALSGVLLADGVTRGDSGTLVGPPPSPAPATPTPAQIVAASKNMVARADGSAAWWLVADAGSSNYSPEIALAGPREVEVTVSGPLGGLQGASTVRHRLTLLPGGAPAPLPGIVLELPGLLVAAVSPGIHTQVQPKAKVGFAAKVTMMCGCQIGDGGSYWPAGDFEVQTLVTELQTGTTYPFAMSLSQDATQPSTFVSDKEFVVGPSNTGTVFYQATITAFQRSTGNAGSAVVNFFCVYS